MVTTLNRWYLSIASYKVKIKIPQSRVALTKNQQPFAVIIVSQKGERPFSYVGKAAPSVFRDKVMLPLSALGRDAEQSEAEIFWVENFWNTAEKWIKNININ